MKCCENTTDAGSGAMGNLAMMVLLKYEWKMIICFVTKENLAVVLVWMISYSVRKT